MEYEYGLIENALDSLREAMNYYYEGDEKENAKQYKFSILLSAHCAELKCYTNVVTVVANKI